MKIVRTNQRLLKNYESRFNFEVFISETSGGVRDQKRST